MRDRLVVWNVLFSCTDTWEASASLLPAAKRVMSQKGPVAIEHNNCRNRHWLEL